jgi:hypothetical protein
MLHEIRSIQRNTIAPSMASVLWLRIKYLCTYDLYGPVRNVFDAGRYLRGEVVGGWR